jgi:photosystem II stability/assembly factor-like uncharacterized protein
LETGRSINKSQTATEYLIILAVVITIALIVVGTFGGLTAIGGAGDDSSNRAILAVSEIGVVDYAGTSSGMLVSLQNNKPFSVELVAVSLSGVNCTNSSLPVVMNIGGKQTLFCPNIVTTAEKYSHPIQVHFREIRTGAMYTIAPGTIKGRLGQLPNTYNHSLYALRIAQHSIAQAIINATLYNPSSTSLTIANISTQWGRCVVVGGTYPVVVGAYANSTVRLDCINVSGQTMRSNRSITTPIPYSFSLFVTYVNGTVESQSLVNTSYDVLPEFSLSGFQIHLAMNQNASHIIASTTDGLFRTTDFGANWTQLTNVYIRNLKIADSGQFMVGYLNGNGPVISNDSGSTWVWSGLGWWYQSNIGISNTGQYILVGDVGGGGPLQTSQNYGQTWQIAINTSQWWKDASISSNGSIQLAIAGNNSYLSTNYGLNWTLINISRNWNAISMTPTGQYMTMISDTVFYSSDYGATWNESVTPSSCFTGIALSSSGQYQLATAGCGHGYYVSSNYGVNWTRYGQNSNFWTPHISANGSICIMSNDTNSFSSSFLYSTTYCTNWSTNHREKHLYSSATSKDGSMISLASNGGHIYASTDGGNSWSTQATTRAWWDIDMSDDGQYRVAVVGNGNAYTSSDYGSTWIQRSPTIGWRGCSAINNNGSIMLVAGNNNFIYYSTDYGITWSSYNKTGEWSGCSIGLNGSAFFVAGSNDFIQYSSNSGLNWTSLYTNSSWMYVMMSENGSVVSASGPAIGVHISRNMGLNWTLTPLSSYLWNSPAICQNGQTILLGNTWGSKLTISNDFGTTFTTKEYHRRWFEFFSMSDDCNVLVATTPGNKVYISHDGGNIWIPKTIS